MHIRAKTKLAGLLGVAALALGLPATASASPLLGGDTLWQDLSGEELGYDQTGAFNGTTCIDPSGCATGRLDIGDTLRGIIHITSGTTTNPLGTFLTGTPGTLDVSAVFESEVKTKTGCVAGPPGLGSLCNYSFTPHGQFATDLGLAAGAMVAFYTEPVTPSDFTLGPSTPTGVACTTTGNLNDCESNIVDGAVYLVLGQKGTDPDATWLINNAPDNIVGVAGTPFLTPLGAYVANFDIITNLTGSVFGQVSRANLFTDSCFLGVPPPGGDCLVDVSANGQVLGINGISGGSPYDAYDKTTFHLNAQQVPEPGTLAMFGFGLLGLGALGRRRKSQS